MDEYKCKTHQPARIFKTKYSAKPAKKRCKIRQTDWLIKLANKLLDCVYYGEGSNVYQAYNHVHIVKLTFKSLYFKCETYYSKCKTYYLKCRTPFWNFMINFLVCS